MGTERDTVRVRDLKKRALRDSKAGRGKKLLGATVLQFTLSEGITFREHTTSSL